MNADDDAGVKAVDVAGATPVVVRVHANPVPAVVLPKNVAEFFEAGSSLRMSTLLW